MIKFAYTKSNRNFVWTCLMLMFLLTFPSFIHAWWNGNWSYRVRLEVNPDHVDTTLTDFPVYVNLANLPSTFFDNVISGCGDLRVVKSDNLTELPREIVFCNTGTDTGEIHFKADSLSASATTTFYIYYGNSSASDHADNATYGAENVWTNNFQAVYHFQGAPTGTVEDSTANGYDGTASNMDSSNQVTGRLSGDGYDFNGSNEEIRDTDQVWASASNAASVSMWANVPSTASLNTAIAFIGSGERVLFHLPEFGDVKWDFGTCCGADARLTGSYAAYDDKYTHVFGISNGVDLQTIYLDGVSTYTKASADSPNVDITGLSIASEGGSVFFDGVLDEVRLATAVRSTEWVDAEYTNQNTPTTFYFIGAEEGEAAQDTTSRKLRLFEGFRIRLFGATLRLF